MVLKIFNKNKEVKHRWKPCGSPFIANGKVFIAEHCELTGVYRYVKVPSYKTFEELEAQDIEDIKNGVK